MLFRFAITWLALGFALVGAYQPAAYNDEPITLDALVPFEKFVEGDVSEPYLYSQYQVIGNVSPYIPSSFLASLSSATYQTPANSYEPAKPIPANFNVYTPVNPAPVQYKPAKPVYGQPPVSYSSAPQYALPPPPPAYSAPLPAYPAPPLAYSAPLPAYPASYGLNYAPLPAYPAPLQSYLVPPTAGYTPASSYMPAPFVAYEAPKAEASKANETEKIVVEAVDPKADPPIDLVDVKPSLSAVPNEAPAIKPAAKPVKVVVDLKKPAVDLPKPLPVHPIGGYPRANVTGKRTEVPRVTGYRYVAATSRRRSVPSTPTRSNQQYYRSAPYQPSNPNPYPPSKYNQTIGYKRNSYSYGSPYKAAAKDSAKRGAGYAPGYASSYAPQPAAGYSSAPQYAPPSYLASSYPPKSYYPAASASYAQPNIYNENNVAEAVLRGYSVSPEENNNKAIVRVFEESNYGVYFDLRVCDLKKDRLYSIYIHDYGSVTAGCESAGGQFGGRNVYFNPILGLKTNPSGFLGSFKFNGENLNIQHFAKSLRLDQLIGRSIVIHEVQTNQKILPEAIEKNMLNTFTLLMNPLSSPLVTSRKVACGPISRANPYDYLRPVNQNCEIEIPLIEEKPVVDPVERKRDVKDGAEPELGLLKKDIKFESPAIPVEPKIPI